MKVALQRLIETRDRLREFKESDLMFPLGVEIALAGVIGQIEQLIQAFDTAKSRKIMQLGEPSGPNQWTINPENEEAMAEFFAYVNDGLQAEFELAWTRIGPQELHDIGVIVPRKYLIDLDYLFDIRKKPLDQELSGE